MITKILSNTEPGLIDRIYEERHALHKKMEALLKKVPELDESNQTVLYEQLSHMAKYARTLSLRLDEFPDT